MHKLLYSFSTLRDLAFYSSGLLLLYTILHKAIPYFIIINTRSRSNDAVVSANLTPVTTVVTSKRENIMANIYI